MASRTAVRVFAATGTMGNLTVSAHLPTSESAYFAGAGFVSMNSAVCSGISLSWNVSALA
jgi:hypothetical protein